MPRFAGHAAFLFVVFVTGVGPARAQYNYPRGYGGWGGWGGGGSTVQGSIASGMGNFAAGAGAYNVQTAEARSMNVNTAMQANEYMYATRVQNASNEAARMDKQIQRTTKTADATFKRLHDNPTGQDVHDGDALNVVLDELVNPKFYTQVTQKSTTKIDSELVKNIEFEFAARMILISLEDVSARGAPDELVTNPAFASDRQAFRTLVAQGKREAQGSNEVSLETLRSFRAAVKAAQDKVALTYALGTRQRDECDNYLKALYGIAKMLEKPNVAAFLKGLNKYPTTTLGQLISFMHSFNLRFGAAKTPDQETAYDQLYPLLVNLRDGVGAQGPNPATTQVALPDPKRMNTFFSGMDYSHFQPQPDPHTGVVPPPPPAQAPR